MTDTFDDLTNPATPHPSRSVFRRLAQQDPEAMAAALRAVGWVCYLAGEDGPEPADRDARARGHAYTANERRRTP
jgi:hypothetical protein